MLKLINKWMFGGWIERMKERKKEKTNEWKNASRIHAYTILSPLNPTFI